MAEKKYGLTEEQKVLLAKLHAMKQEDMDECDLNAEGNLELIETKGNLYNMREELKKDLEDVFKMADMLLDDDLDKMRSFDYIDFKEAWVKFYMHFLSYSSVAERFGKEITH